MDQSPIETAWPSRMKERFSRIVAPVWERERFPTLAGIEIVGGHAGAVGIELRRTMQCLISGVLVRGRRHGVHLVDRNRNVVVSDTHLYDNDETGLFVDRCDLHQMNLHGCHVSYNKRAGIRVLGGRRAQRADRRQRLRIQPRRHGRGRPPGRAGRRRGRHLAPGR